MRLKMFFTILLLSAIVCAQVAVRPPAASGAAPAEPDPKEACSIEGRAVNASTGEGLRNATVSLQPSAGAPPGSPSYNVATDAEGKFAIKGIAAGAYRLTARRAAYLQTEYGSRALGRPGTPLTLVPRQAMTALELRLTPGAVIAGKVIDESGDPVQRAQVTVMRSRYVNGERQNSMAGMGGPTDDQGNYRVFGLEPGRYYVRAEPDSMSAAQPALQSQLTYLPVYYPGTSDESAASQIALDAGSEMLGIDLTLARSRAYRVTAQVQNLTGVNGRIIGMLRANRSGLTLTSNRFVMLDQQKAKVEFQGIGPGSYSILLGMNEQGEYYSGRTDFDVADKDVTNLVVTLAAGFNLPGEIRVEDSAKTNLGAMRIVLRGKTSTGIGINGVTVKFGSSADERVGDDGKFLLPGLFPDIATLALTGVPDGFYVKSAQMGEQEVLESGLDLSKGPRGDLRIVLSGKAGTVTGSVADADDKPVGGATVVLIPKSEKRRGNSQFYRTANADQQGRFTIKGVDPGDYKAYAWEDVETQAWLDSEFVKPVEGKGVAVTVDPSGQHQLQLKAIAAGT